MGVSGFGLFGEEAGDGGDAGRVGQGKVVSCLEGNLVLEADFALVFEVKLDREFAGGLVWHCYDF